MIGLIAFSDLISAKTVADWKKSLADIAALVGLRTENWEEGGFTRTMLALFARLYATASDVVRVFAASAFLDTAEGAWLTIVAQQVFGVDRIEATFAKAALGLTLTNTSGLLFTFDPGDLIVAKGDGKTYRNTSGGTLDPGAGHTLQLDLQAEEAGSGGNALAHTIETMVTTFPGVTCTNGIGLTGIDEEKDAALRLRCRDSLARASIGGIKKAYDYFARSATRADGSAIGVTRVRIPTPLGDGSLTVYVAQASGAIAVDDVAAIQAIFDSEVTPYGFNATAVSATNLAVSVPCTIWVPSSLGITTASAQQTVLAALKSYVENLPIGGIVIAPDAGKIFWRAVLGVVESAIPGALKAQLVSETDTTLSIGQVPIWAGALSDTTVVQVT